MGYERSRDCEMDAAKYREGRKCPIHPDMASPYMIG